MLWSGGDVGEKIDLNLDVLNVLIESYDFISSRYCFINIEVNEILGVYGEENAVCWMIEFLGDAKLSLEYNFLLYDI